MENDPTPIDDVRKYWNQYVIGIDISDKTVGSSEFFDEIGSYHHGKYSVESTVIDFRRTRGKKLLEVGCGWGCDLIRFAKNGANVTGVDLSESAINLARLYFGYRQIPAHLSVGNAESLQFRDEEFDVVVSLGVLHHTPDTQKSIDEIYRVLKPGGDALIMLYHKYSWYKLLSKISGTNFKHNDRDPPIIKLYSKKEVLRMLSKFTQVEIEITRLPDKTIKRRGLLALLYNKVLVPACHIIPKRLVKPFGFHINIRATKC
jgi:ubiquinone/menaquinone biosynthesis C-methylase UbiE